MALSSSVFSFLTSITHQLGQRIHFHCSNQIYFFRIMFHKLSKYSILIAILVDISLALSLQTSGGASSSLADTTSSFERSLSSSILESLRQRTVIINGQASDEVRKLNVATDLYDPSTGLHSEGIWHNSLVGIASLRLGQMDAACRIADSLWKHSWDGTSFRRRTHSGMWDHSSEQNLEQANYYRDSSEHRCVQHGMALVFWSLLVVCSDKNESKQQQNYKDQQCCLAESFLREYWDAKEEKWHTVSRAQGWGTIDRRSASAGRATIVDDDDDQRSIVNSETYYYRAVDQAVALLACLVALPIVKAEGKTTTTVMEGVITKTCQTLLGESGGFGYSNDDNARSYINLTRNRNFWHDGWVVLALLGAEQRGYLEEEEQIQIRELVHELVLRYGHSSSSSSDDDNEEAEELYDGTLWHWSNSLKPNENNVRYCGDNALWYAIRQNLKYDDDLKEEEDEAFRDFVQSLLQPQESDDLATLVSVADVYPQVRLHPNTELACLLLWQFDEFFAGAS